MKRGCERLMCFLFRTLTLKFRRWLEASGYIYAYICILCDFYYYYASSGILIIPFAIRSFLFSLCEFCLRVSLIKFDVLIFQLFLYHCTKAISPKWQVQACTCMSDEYRLTKQWITHEPNRKLTIKWSISSKTFDSAPSPLFVSAYGIEKENNQTKSERKQ